MSLSRIFEISASAMTAQTQRLSTVASNLANADSVAGPDGKAYKARQVQFQAVPLDARPGAAAGNDIASQASLAVAVTGVSESDAPGRRVFDPKHPSADKDGYVSFSNVNVVDEMVNMISASRSYQTNVEVMNTARQLLMKTLSLGS